MSNKLTKIFENKKSRAIFYITLIFVLLISFIFPVFADNTPENTGDNIIASQEQISSEDQASSQEQKSENEYNPDECEFPDIKSLSGKKAAVYIGSIDEVITLKHLTECDYAYYNTFADCLLSVESRKTDCTVIADVFFNQVSSQYPNLTYQEEVVESKSSHFGIANTEFGATINKDLTEYINTMSEQGKLDEMLDYWEKAGNSTDVPYYDYTELPSEKGVITFAMEPLDAPLGHIVGTKWTGYEAQIMYEFAKEYGYGVDAKVIEFTSILAGINTGKIDVTGFFGYTEERAEKVLYSPAYLDEDYIVVVRKKSDMTVASNGNIFAKIAESVKKNYLREERWKFMLSGLGVTLQISLFAGLFGIIFGCFLCVVRLNRNVVLRNIAKVFIRIIQGVPIVVILLILYYIVFVDSRMPGVIVAIVGFSINFGVDVCECLRSGISSVDKGQIEAAKALGFSKLRTYRKVVLPQAINTAMPVFKAQYISMVKLTSIVGYIAVQDLTEVTDIIRSRTYDAFIPLIISAIIYFFLSWGLSLLLGMIELKTHPEHRKKVLKDVDKTKEITGDFKRSSKTVQSENVIRIKHICKDFGNVMPLKDVTADVHRGDVVALIGPSGTGKSTLLRCINGLVEPTKGEIYVLDEKVDPKEKSIYETRMKLGMVFQSFNLFDHLTIIENIMLAPVDLKNISRQEAYENGIRLLRRIGLEDKAFAYPSSLSGGQKQRAAIARALAMDPEVLLLDEPISALDPSMIKEVVRVVEALGQSGMTMMIVTHDMKFAKDVSTRVFYMDKGIIMEDGPTEQIFENPKEEGTKEFVRRLNLDD